MLVKETKNLESKVKDLEEIIANHKADNERNKASFQLKMTNLSEQINSKIVENEDLKKDLKIKETKLLDMENREVKAKDDLDNIKKKVKHLEEVNSQYLNEVKDINTSAANYKDEITLKMNAKDTELEKLQNIHNILKDLYEKQHVKYYTLVETKEMLEKLLEKQVKELKDKNKIINECVNCKKSCNTGSGLKRHAKTIYSKEC